MHWLNFTTQFKKKLQGNIVMCGICGIYNFDEKSVQPEQLERMTNVARHRGPDDEGYLFIDTKTNNIQHAHHKDTVDEIRRKTPNLYDSFKANLAFGYRRLSILDLSANGHQPMADKDQDLWITFNGEIYNFIEIREKLLQKGYQFYSNCDTEVILYAYREWGADCLKKFNGMFALAIWDRKNSVLFCARDRIGIKPFYYYLDKNKLVWGSEIKQLLVSGLINAEPDLNNIYQYLLHSHQNLDNTTFFRNINELPPGHFCFIKNRKLTIEKYWDLATVEEHVNQSEDSYKNKFLDIFTHSIQLRMRSDVPLGIALSGGLDSSSIAMMASRLTENPINTFSVYYENAPQFDERPYINEVLTSGNFNPVFFTSKGDFSLEQIKNWIYFQDEPCISASPFSAFHNYKNIKEAGVTVALNGQGGDETLAGYKFYYKYYLLSLLKQRNLSKFLADFVDIAKNDNKDIIKSSMFFSQIVARLVFPSHIMRQNEHIHKINRQYYDKNLLNLKSDVRFDRPFNSELNNKLYETLAYTIIPRLLHWEDRNSMAFSVESRVPFLDHNLVEFLYSLPNEHKINGKITKVILRNAMKGILPEKVLIRTDKIGFGTPTDIWTSDTLHSDIFDLFNSKKFRERGLFKSDLFVEKYKIEPDYFKKNEIWKIMALELWFNNFIDKN